MLIKHPNARLSANAIDTPRGIENENPSGDRKGGMDGKTGRVRVEKITKKRIRGKKEKINGLEREIERKM